MGKYYLYRGNKKKKVYKFCGAENILIKKFKNWLFYNLMCIVTQSIKSHIYCQFNEKIIIKKLLKDDDVYL